MVMAHRFFRMVISTMESILMVLLMDMESIFGLMEVHTKEILSMELDMAMVSGTIKSRLKYTLVAIEWTKSKVLAYMNGSENKHIKVNSVRIFEKVSADCTKYAKNCHQNPQNRADLWTNE